MRGLHAAGRAGRLPRLNARQLQKVEAALKKGAVFHGFTADRWTLPRVATVIERLTGVRYHPGHVWKVLGSMKWSSQKPAQQAKERNAQKVAYWKSVRWPEIKKKLRSSGPGSSSKMSPGSVSSLPSGGPGRRGARRPS